MILCSKFNLLDYITLIIQSTSNSISWYIFFENYCFRYQNCLKLHYSLNLEKKIIPEIQETYVYIWSNLPHLPFLKWVKFDHVLHVTKYYALKHEMNKGGPPCVFYHTISIKYHRKAQTVTNVSTNKIHIHQADNRISWLTVGICQKHHLVNDSCF